MSKRPLDFLVAELGQLEATRLLRRPDASEAREVARDAAADAGAPLVDASSNDYLGYARSGVSRATLLACEGIAAGAGASRLIHGTAEPIPSLEAELAQWVGADAALVFSSGYAANVGTIAALAAAGDVVVSDRLNHASLIDGGRLSRARVVVVPHLRVEAVEAALREAPEARRWVVTESYFSMDGDAPDLAALRAVCDRWGAALVVDEAHALGVFGPAGAGRCRDAGVVPDVLVGTLGKALGVQGAFVAGSEHLRTFLWNRARSFVFSTGLSPLLAAVVLEHVRRAQADDVGRARVLGHADQLRARLRGAELDVAPSLGPIVPLLFNDSGRCVEAAAALARLGILAQPIRPPTVPAGARLRITVTAAMSADDVARLGDALVRVCRGS